MGWVPRNVHHHAQHCARDLFPPQGDLLDPGLGFSQSAHKVCPAGHFLASDSPHAPVGVFVHVEQSW